MVWYGMLCYGIQNPGVSTFGNFFIKIQNLMFFYEKSYLAGSCNIN